LTHFAIYNAASIAIFLVKGSSVLRSKITCGRLQKLKPWSFWSALGSVVLQILGMVVTALLIRASGYHADIWQLVQVWSVRPRVSWFIGNMANVERKYGYMNGALDNVVVEVFICSLGCVFVGRLARAALTHFDATGPMYAYFWIICVASLVMLVLTGVEVIWALWVTKRTIETRMKAEAQDMDSMRWIVRVLVPLTCVCSWLIWAAFLKSTQGAYCPGNIHLVDLTWIMVPIVTNLMRTVVEALTPL
jgi:hypothetical protein